MSRMLEALKQIESLSQEVPPRVDEAPDVSEPVEEQAAVAEPVDLSAVTELVASVLRPAESLVVAMPPIDPPPEPSPETPSPPQAQVDAKRPVHQRHFIEMAANILGQMPPSGRATLLFVGAEPEPLGSLAAVLADRTGGQVLLVDCDIRREEPTNFLGVPTPNQPGLAEVLGGVELWREAVAGTQVKGVDVLPGSRLRRRLLPEQLADGDVSGLVAELRKRYRLVLFAGTRADDPLVARLTVCCTGTYLAVRLGQTQRRSAARTIRSLQRAGGRVLGTIVSDC